MSKILYLTLSFGVLSCSTAMAMQNDGAFDDLRRRINSPAAQEQFAAIRQRMNNAEMRTFHGLEQRGIGLISETDNERRQAQQRQIQAQILENRRQAQISESQMQAQIQAEDKRRQAEESQFQAQMAVAIAASLRHSVAKSNQVVNDDVEMAQVVYEKAEEDYEMAEVVAHPDTSDPKHRK